MASGEGSVSAVTGFNHLEWVPIGEDGCLWELGGATVTRISLWRDHPDKAWMAFFGAPERGLGGTRHFPSLRAAAQWVEEMSK